MRSGAAWSSRSGGSRSQYVIQVSRAPLLVLVVFSLLALCGTVLATIAASSQEDEEPAAVVEGPESPFKGAVRPRRLRASSRCETRTRSWCGWTTCAARWSCSRPRTRRASRAPSPRCRSAGRWTTSPRASATACARSRSASTRRTTILSAHRSSCSRAGSVATSTTCSARVASCSRSGASTALPPRPRSASTTRIVLLDGEGRQRVGFDPVRDPGGLAHDIRLLLG